MQAGPSVAMVVDLEDDEHQAPLVVEIDDEPIEAGPHSWPCNMLLKLLHNLLAWVATVPGSQATEHLCLQGGVQDSFSGLMFSMQGLECCEFKIVEEEDIIMMAAVFFPADEIQKVGDVLDWFHPLRLRPWKILGLRILLLRLDLLRPM